MSKKVNNFLKNAFHNASPDNFQDLETNPNNSVYSYNDVQIYSKKRKSTTFKILSAATVCAVIVVAIILNPLNLFSSIKDDPLSVNYINDESTLYKLLQTRDNIYYTSKFNSSFRDGAMENDAIEAPTSNGSNGFGNKLETTTKISSTEDDFSKTNTQVEGVDESDIIKTDGEYVYYISKGTFYIIDVKDPENMKIVTEKKYDYPDYNDNRHYDYDEQSSIGYSFPVEMYVDGNYLAIIFSCYDNVSNPENDGYYDWYYWANEYTEIRVFDITDKSDIKLIKNDSFDGQYSTSRKVGDIIYVIGYKNISSSMKIDDILPGYRNNMEDDTAWSKISLDKIQYFSEIKNDNNTIQYIIGTNIKDASAEANIQTFLNSGHIIYANSENLYIVGTSYEYTKTNSNPESGGFMGLNSIFSSYDYDYYVECNTVISKFSMDNGKVTFESMGVVKGNVLNQFSMDEYNGYFRIAATVDAWQSGSGESVNNLYILDDEMKIAGSVENLAKGERIYSVRFIGNKVYIVTFRTMDPLFVIDLEDPFAPKVLGELKIPGYSSYLHPYDETHIIGFGMDTREVGYDQFTTEGIKIAMFDVSDFSNPKEMFKTSLGLQGSSSELLYNHKALLFSKEKDVFAFPATVCEKYNYENSYQGFFNYSIDMDKGFVLRGTVSHRLSINNYYDEYGYNYNYDYDISRGVYIGDILFTFSDKAIRANRLYDMGSISKLELR